MPPNTPLTGEIVSSETTVTFSSAPHSCPTWSDGQEWDPDRVAREIRYHTEQIVSSIFTIGKRLRWAKAILPHGAFSAWCAKELPFSERSVQNYIQVHAFLESNPALISAASSAGLKKTLLLSTLAPDQLEYVVREGLPSASIDQLDSVPYAKLKAEVEKLRASKEEDARKLNQAIRDREEAIRQVGEMRVSRAKAPTEVSIRDELLDLDERVSTLLDETEAYLQSHATNIATDAYSSELTSDLLGFADWLFTRVEVLKLRLENASAVRGTTQGQIDAAAQRPRVAADRYPIPDNSVPFPSKARKSR